jgi:hypothetical protein
MKNDINSDSIGINLITQREKNRSSYSKIFLIAAAGFGIIFAFAILLTFYSFFLKAKADSLAKDVAAARNETLGYALRKQKILFTSERVDAVRSIISKRNNLEEITSQVLSAIPDNFNIESVAAQDNVVSVRLASSSLLAFDDFLESRLQAFAKNKDLRLKKIESSSFVRDSGSYILAISFYF